MKRFLLLLWIVPLLFSLAACDGPEQKQAESTADTENTPITQTAAPEETEPGSLPETDAAPTEDFEMLQIEVIIAEKTFSATLYDNAAAKALFDMLPMTVSMNELNGNEKYHYLRDSLPNDPERPDAIQKGDLMLYGDDCLVLFYESFSTSYSYTPLGRLDDPAALAEILGPGSVTVTFRRG